jgi:hypothetical protein
MDGMRSWAVLALVACGQEGTVSSLEPEPSVLPAEVDFGEVVLGTTAGPTELHLANAGPVDLHATVTLTGADAGAFTLTGGGSLVVAPDGSLPLTVAFSPTDLGPAQAALHVAWNDPDEPTRDVPLLGTGRVPYAPDIEVVPVLLDLGTVAAGSATTGVVEIRNVGDGDLVLGSLRQTGAGMFVLDTDPSGATIAPLQSRAVVVTYTAVADDGDSGTLTVPSNDADEPEVSVELRANGGSALPYPEAVVDCPGEVTLDGAVTVHLDGSASFDPDGGGLTYTWAIVRRPDGANPATVPVPVDGPETDVLVDAAGTWEVTLQVATGAGVSSAPTKCVLDVVPADPLHVELSWAGPTSDLDLHVAEQGAARFDVPGDVCWCNTDPGWAVLSLDDDDGFGPEHVDVPSPTAGDYAVRVHAFDDGDDGAVTARVQVFTNGALAWSGSQVLERNEVWEVGAVHWPDGTFGVSPDDPWDAGGLRGCP